MDSTGVPWGGFVTTSQGRTHLVMDARKYKRTTTQRLTVVLSGVAFQRIEERSQREGRSMSNLVAYLVERALDVPTD